MGFIYGLEEKNRKSEVVFAVCRLPLTSCLTSLIFPVFLSLQPILTKYTIKICCLSLPFPISLVAYVDV